MFPRIFSGGEVATEAAHDKSEHADHSSEETAEQSEFSWRKRREIDEKSQQPLELGVVQTGAGVVAPGIVLAGILAGREPQTVKVYQTRPNQNQTPLCVWLQCLQMDLEFI